MTPNRWEEIKQMIITKFPVEYQGIEDTDDMIGTMEVLECQGPIGTIRLEYVSRPRAASQRTGGAYGKKVKSETEDDEALSDTLHALNIFMWDDNEKEWTSVSQDLISHL